MTAEPARYRETFASFPLRAGIDALRGNVVIALGNSGDEPAVEPLSQTLHHTTPQIRAYSAWSLSRIGGGAARRALEDATPLETDPIVREELERALLPQHG